MAHDVLGYEIKNKKINIKKFLRNLIKVKNIF